jgi:hypothetical protein
VTERYFNSQITCDRKIPLPQVAFYAFPPPPASVFQEQLLSQPFLLGGGAQLPVRPLIPFLGQLVEMQGIHHPVTQNLVALNKYNGNYQ